MAEITIKLTSTGYYLARGFGPCEWAQWPRGEELAEEHFFPEASEHFRRSLRAYAASRELPLDEEVADG